MFGFSLAPLIAWLVGDAALNFGKKAAVMASVLAVLVGLKFGIESVIDYMAIEAPAAMSDAVSMFVPADFGTFVDFWVVFYAAAGTVKLGRYFAAYFQT